MDLPLTFARFAHVLVAVYWLGGDLGTFLCGRAVRDAALPAAARLAALRLLLAVDMGPRCALILALPTGLALAAAKGWLVVPPGALLVAWALGLGWLALAWAVHLRHGPEADRLRRIDLAVRYVVLAGLVTGGAAGFTRVLPLPLFVAIKLLLLAAAIALGILVRRQLVPLFLAIAALRAEGANPATDAAIHATLLTTTRTVLCIWAVVLLAMFTGLSTPL